MFETLQGENLIELKIDFQDRSSPARIFSALSEFVTVLNDLDAAFIGTISPNLQSNLILTDVQKGSIKVFLRNFLLSLDDEGLKNCDWKKVVGNYLYIAKYKVLEFVQDNKGLPTELETGLPDREKINHLIKDLTMLAEATDIKNIPVYEKISTKRLLNTLSDLSSALSKLDDRDKISYITPDSTVELNSDIVITLEAVNAFLIEKSVQSQETLILKVKKPDYLGFSQWEFKQGKNAIKAKITDEAWLKAFQERRVLLNPGDSLVAQVEIISDLDFEGRLIETHYNVYRVTDILSLSIHSQQNLFDTTKNQISERQMLWGE